MCTRAPTFPHPQLRDFVPYSSDGESPAASTEVVQQLPRLPSNRPQDEAAQHPDPTQHSHTQMTPGFIHLLRRVYVPCQFCVRSFPSSWPGWVGSDFLRSTSPSGHISQRNLLPFYCSSRAPGEQRSQRMCVRFMVDMVPACVCVCGRGDKVVGQKAGRPEVKVLA